MPFMLCTKMNGHQIYYDEMTKKWIYSDNDEIMNPQEKRPCIRCGELPTGDGHDSCIANLGNVINACCGHGVEEGYIQFDNGITIRGNFKVERK